MSKQMRHDLDFQLINRRFSCEQLLSFNYLIHLEVGAATLESV